MATWAEVTAVNPEFAARVRQRLDTHQRKTLATLRRDGAPRISGIETVFVNGELSFGLMRDSLKARDLYRDPRMVLHTDPADVGDGVTITGLAVEVPDPARPGSRTYRFRVDVREVVLGHDGNSGEDLETWQVTGVEIS